LTAYFSETAKTLEKSKKAFVAPCWIIDQLGYDLLVKARISAKAFSFPISLY